MNMLPNDKDVLNHYKLRWGTPNTIHTFDAPQVPVIIRPLYVAEFVLPADGLTVYASIGMSRTAMKEPQTTNTYRSEIFLGVFERNESLPKTIAMLAAYPHINKTFIAPEHTIPLGDKIVPGSHLSSVIFTHPYFDPPWFETIESRNNKIQVLWIIPISEHERDYKMLHGWNALVTVFENNNIVVGDLLRNSTI